jgi:hypothetical protein
MCSISSKRIISKRRLWAFWLGFITILKASMKAILAPNMLNIDRFWRVITNVWMVGYFNTPWPAAPLTKRRVFIFP